MSTFHERQFEKIQSEILLNNPDMEPPSIVNEAGLSMPMDKIVLNKVTLVASHFVHGDLKFVKITEEKFLEKYTVFLFMDQNITEEKKNEWMEISANLKNIKSRDSRVFGVMPISHRRVSQKMKKGLPVEFPVISDNTGEFAEAFGVGDLEDLVGKSGQLKGSARGFAVLDKSMKMRYLSLESVPIDTKHILTILDKIKEKDLVKVVKDKNNNEMELPSNPSLDMGDDIIEAFSTAAEEMKKLGNDAKEAFDKAGKELKKLFNN